MPSSPRALMLLLAVTMALSSVGCSSNDKHTFVSTALKPATLTLMDSNQNQSVWEMDIPVNHKLVLDFENSIEQTDATGRTPSWVNWKLYRADDQPTDTGRDRKGALVRSDRVDLTGTRVRMLLTYRPSPEMPGSLDAAPVPMMETAESVAAEAAAEAKAQSATATEEAAEAIEEAEEIVEQSMEEVEAVDEAEIVEEAEVIEEAEEAPVEEATK